MGMTGSWHIYRRGETWRKPTHYASLVLVDRRARSHLLLAEAARAADRRPTPHITPTCDDSAPTCSPASSTCRRAVQRFRARNHLPLGEAVMNQTIVCGIGNVYKSDLLFLMGFDPFAPVAKFTDDELAAMIERARRLMLRNLAAPPRQTRSAATAGGSGCYGQRGRGRASSAAPIIKLRRQGEAGRTTCWCPTCQPAA